MALAAEPAPRVEQPHSLATDRSSQEKKPAYVARGDEVEAKYRDYTKKLETAYLLLKSNVRKDAPELYRKLNPEPPKVVPFGYQIVPTLTKDPPFEERLDPPRPTSTPYSWSRTSLFIDWELPKIEEMIEQIKAAQSLENKSRRPIYERYIRDYATLEANQRLVDNHIQYNRFWQKTIAEDRPRFDRLTKLHDLVIRHQEIRDALGAKTEAEYQQHVRQIPEIDHSLPRSAQEPNLREIEKRMADMIHAQNQNIRPARYLKLSHPKPNVWDVTVPVYTDIQDRKFIADAKRAIERLWTIERRENTYRMHVILKSISPLALYKNAKPPKRGEHIDITAHAAKFPKDGGVLTTGANSTYAIPSQYIALGPQPISHNVLAHEFGHLLGFVDGYFRGYHDLGNEGFEVIEVVPDPEDIMCTPGAGRVLPLHYETIFTRSGHQKTH